MEMVGGQARFRRPDGAVIPDVPSAPALPADPIEALVQAHAAAGIEIDAWTAAPRGTGERLDLAWAIAMLWRPSREVEELAVEAS